MPLAPLQFSNSVLLFSTTYLLLPELLLLPPPNPPRDEDDEELRAGAERVGADCVRLGVGVLNPLTLLPVLLKRLLSPALNCLCVLLGLVALVLAGACCVFALCGALLLVFIFEVRLPLGCVVLYEVR